MASGTQFFPKLGVVIDFAVEGEDGITVFARHGLIAALQIDDSQTDCADRDRLRLVEALLIRPSMS
jgi:hypothetical protein